MTLFDVVKTHFFCHHMYMYVLSTLLMIIPDKDKQTINISSSYTLVLNCLKFSLINLIFLLTILASTQTKLYYLFISPFHMLIKLHYLLSLLNVHLNGGHHYEN